MSRGRNPGRPRCKQGGKVNNQRESSVARQSSHPGADGPVGQQSIPVQARVNQRWVPDNLRGRERAYKQS